MSAGARLAPGGVAALAALAALAELAKLANAPRAAFGFGALAASRPDELSGGLGRGAAHTRGERARGGAANGGRVVVHAPRARRRYRASFGRDAHRVFFFPSHVRVHLVGRLLGLRALVDARVDAAQVALELAPGARGEDLRALAAGAPRRRARRRLGDERRARRLARRRGRSLGRGKPPLPGERPVVQAARRARSSRERARRAHDVERRIEVARDVARRRPRRREAPPGAGAQHPSGTGRPRIRRGARAHPRHASRQTPGSGCASPRAQRAAARSTAPPAVISRGRTRSARAPMRAARAEGRRTRSRCVGATARSPPFEKLSFWVFAKNTYG